jgi:hypothetical protein
MGKRDVVSIGLAGIGLLTCYHMLFGQFFPNLQGKLGHDYALFLPKLLDGYYWYRSNGVFAVPWFTPAFCAGIPLFPDPQSMYYSVPQFLSFWFDPLTSVYVTLLVFAGIGLVGFYLLLRYVFFTTAWTAFLGGGLFLFNGFYTYRMIIGHLTYHPFMLVPLLAFFLLRATPAHPQQRLRSMGDIVMAGLIMAYMFQAGMVNVILPALASVVALALLHSIIQRRSSAFWTRLLWSGCLSLGLCSAKLVAAMAYLRYFGRDSYTLPGARSLVEAVVVVVQSLFFAPAHERVAKSFVQVQWGLGRHELEYGVTFVPLLLLLMGGIARIFCARVQKQRHPRLSRHWLQMGGLVVLLLLPVLFNYYSPIWNTVLKHLPVLKNSSSLIRWVCLYIPVVILVAVLELDRIRTLRRYQSSVVLLGLVVVVALYSGIDHAYYHAQPYDPRLIVATYRQQQQEPNWTPAIQHTAVASWRPDGRAILSLIGRNNALAYGRSQIFCYEPLFGYELEKFPLGTLFLGALMDEKEGYLNLKNPACYVYPTANGCTLGTHFTVQQRAAAEAFTTYQPFAFQMPLWQRLANFLNLVVLTGTILFLLYHSWRRCWVWLARAGRRGLP